MDIHMKRIHFYSIAAAVIALAACSADQIVAPEVTVNLGTCTNLQAPAGTKQAARVFAKGVQVYRYDGQAWVQITPSAVLTADSAGQSTVGIHYSGPTWEGIGGSEVVGTPAGSCTPNANAIPWLMLTAVSDNQPGVFQSVSFIQRVNTTGGKAPTSAGSVGEVRSVPYTAEYFFYRPL